MNLKKLKNVEKVVLYFMYNWVLIFQVITYLVKTKENCLSSKTLRGLKYLQIIGILDI